MGLSAFLSTQVIDTTSVGRSVMTAANAAAARTALELGTLATQSGTFSGTSSGTNTGDQTITLTGDVTGGGTGSFAATIAAGAVTLSKQADVATGTVFYRKTAGTGSPEVQTLATLKTDLGLTGTNTGDQTITLTGDVTGSGTGSFAATIGAGKVTNAMLAGSIAASKLVGTDIATIGTVTTGTLSTGAVIGGVTMTLGSDATGDIYYRNSGGVLTRLAIGSSGQVLTVSGGLPSWATASGGGSPGGSSGQVQFNNAGAFGGAAAMVYAATGQHLVVTAQAATTVPIRAKGAASHSGNLLECVNSADSLLFYIQSNGAIVSANNLTIATQLTMNDTSIRRISAGILEVNNGTTGTKRDVELRNLGVNGTMSLGGGVGVVFIANATTVPTSNPTGGGILYVESGALKYRGSSGTITTLGPA